jgi:hypothetical protein
MNRQRPGTVYNISGAVVRTGTPRIGKQSFFHLVFYGHHVVNIVGTVVNNMFLLEKNFRIMLNSLKK